MHREGGMILRETSWALQNLSGTSLSLASLPILPQKNKNKNKNNPLPLPAFKSDQVPLVHNSWRGEAAQIARAEMICANPFAEIGPG